MLVFSGDTPLLAQSEGAPLAPSETSPSNRWRGQSPRSGAVEFRERHYSDTLLVVSRAGEQPAPAGLPQNGGFCQNSAAGWVVREGQSLFIADLETDPRLGPPSPGPLNPRPRRLFLVPLRARDGCIGVMAVEREGEFPRADRTAVETL